MSRFPLRLTCQEYRHQLTRDVLKGLLLLFKDGQQRVFLPRMFEYALLHLPADHDGEKGVQTRGEPAQL